MRLFGYPDFVRNPRSGRPERNPLWSVRRLFSGIIWLMAAGFLGLLGAWDIAQHGPENMVVILGAAALLLLLAFWHQVHWNRTIRRLKTAEEKYEMGLQKAFAELEAQTRSQLTD